MSSSGKKKNKTEKLPRRPVVGGIKVNNDDYVQVDVPGDGNCFYYSIYGAAKYHVDPTALDKLLACMRIPKGSVHTFKDFVKAIRIRLATELDKPDGILEAQQRVPIEQTEALEHGERPQTNLYDMLKEYAQAVYAPEETPNYKEVLRALKNDKQELADTLAALEIAADAYDKTKEAKRERNEGNNVAALNAAMRNAKEVYTTARKAVAEAERKIAMSESNLQSVIEFGNEMWKDNIRTLPSQFRNSILARAELYKPGVPNEITIAKFKKEMAKLISGVDSAGRLNGSSTMYVSAFDYLLFKFMLEHCANTVYINSVHPDTGILVDVKDERPVLNIILLDREGPEHYNFYVRGDQYATHIDALKRNAEHVREQHVSKGNTPNSAESNSNESNSNNSSLSSLSSASSNALSSLSPASPNSLSSVSSNSSSSTRKQKEKIQKQYVLLDKRRAALPPSPAKNVRAQLNATKRNSTALYASPSHKNVHTTLKQKGPYNNVLKQKGPYNNVRNQLAAMPPIRPSRGVQGELARLKELEQKQRAPPLPSAPPASPPRGRTTTRRTPKSASPSPGAKAAIQAVANAEKAAAMRPSAPARPSAARPSAARPSAPPVSASRGRTETRRAPKTPSPSPGAKAAIKEVANAEKAAAKTPSTLQRALAKLLGKSK